MTLHNVSNKAKMLLLYSSVALALGACSEPVKVTEPQPQASQELPSTDAKSEQIDSSLPLRELIDAHTNVFIAQQPALATMLALDTKSAGENYNGRFPDYSEQGMKQLQKDMELALQQVSDKDMSQASEEDKLHQKVVRDILSYYQGDAAFGAGYIDTWGGHLPYIINQINGPLIDLPKVMQVQQSVTNQAEIDAYLARLEGLKGLVDEVVSKFKTDMEKGIQLPKKLHPKTLAYFDSFLAAVPAEHALVTSFQSKLSQIDGLEESQQQAQVDKAIRLIKQVVYPAFAKARQAVLDSQKTARDQDGIWSQPNGEAFYLHEIKYLGDSTMSADEIHQVGLDEVARISSQMDAILKENGYQDGTVGQRMVELAKEERFLYEDSDEGRQELLDDLNVQIGAIMEIAPQMYNSIPTQAVEVKRIPPVSEAGEASGFYSPPSLDGSRPGIYWINLRDMAAVPSFGLKTLTYHEAVPGHHFQIALNMAQQNIGLLRQNASFNGYVEGWALYSELVAKEMGMYETDPFGDLGRLQAELYRAVRLVVDTGLHCKKWTREQAIDYFHTTTGTSMTDVVAEVERYMAWPGQALGYKLGMLQFVELRQYAEQQLGEQFDLAEFHDLLLLPGARPMTIVREDVETWVTAKKSG